MIDVIYEDNHLLVLNKPAGILTQPSGTDQLNLEDEAKKWIKVKYQKPGNVFLEAVHRIDKPVSGLVVFCKTSKSLSRLNSTIRAKEAKKTYLAWVEGSLEGSGVLQNHLAHDEHLAKVVHRRHPDAKWASLNYYVIRKSEGKTLVEIDLETGRYHQIRVQFATIHCPICGDVRYGGKQSKTLPDVIALHHVKLIIPHPISRELLTFEAPLPNYFH